MSSRRACVILAKGDATYATIGSCAGSRSAAQPGRRRLNGQRLSAPAELSLESRGAPQELVKLDVLRGGRRIALQMARSQLSLSTEPL